MTDYEKIESHICIHCGSTNMKLSKNNEHQDCVVCGAHYWFRDDDNSWRDSGPSDDYKWAMLGFDLSSKFKDMKIEELVKYLREKTTIK